MFEISNSFERLDTALRETAHTMTRSLLSNDDRKQQVIKTDLDDPYRWRPSDAAILSKCSLILAADCVYDDQATASLVELLRKILPKLSEGAMAMIALERRVNFCLEGLKARAANAECFEAAIRKLAAAGEWLVEKMDVSKVHNVYLRAHFIPLLRFVFVLLK